MTRKFMLAAAVLGGLVLAGAAQAQGGAAAAIAAGTVGEQANIKMLTSCPSCLQGLTRYGDDLQNGLLEADYIVVEMARKILGENWMPEYVSAANAGGIEQSQPNNGPAGRQVFLLFAGRDGPPAEKPGGHGDFALIVQRPQIGRELLDFRQPSRRPLRRAVYQLHRHGRGKRRARCVPPCGQCRHPRR